MPSLRSALSPPGCPCRGRATLREGMAREGSQSPHVTEQGDTDSHLKFGDPWSKNGVKRSRDVVIQPKKRSYSGYIKRVYSCIYTLKTGGYEDEEWNE